RKIQPEYVEPETEDPKDVQEARDHNRYLTWQTAQIDISQQRSKGYNGPKFLVLCKLINHNKDKFVKLTLTGSMKTYRDSDGAIWEVLEPPEERETIKAPLAPDWEYRITFLKRLSDEQAEYIQSHEVQIRDNIELNGKVTPEIMGIK
ncbi:MAG: hypothetical protein IJG37_11475, partial [Synergistaceae bacterium]|nr:hypothetical protein [Synergistaceae bacterium]